MTDTHFFIRIFDSEPGRLKWVSTIAAVDKAACLSSARDAGGTHAAAAAYVVDGGSIRRIGVYGRSGFLLQGDEFR